ncbi:MAG TPA: TlpA disulfide reductase family protein [Candidatus Sulfopaludibacter sp.]|nr:TlpA disulfide reductase family protein [Candidatus Sulfopaludibacter sp.]
MNFQRTTAIEVKIAGFFLCLASTLVAAPRMAVGEGVIALGTNSSSLVIQVCSADGQPIRNANVVCIGPLTNTILMGTSLQGGEKRFQTDDEGRFNLPLKAPNVAVAVADDHGFCLKQSRDLAAHPTMTLEPWGRIEGVRLNNGRPLARAQMSWDVPGDFLVSTDLEFDLDEGFTINDNKTVTDSEGHFVFERVPPVEVTLRTRYGQLYGLDGEINVKPGKINHITIATDGRDVVGRLELEARMTNLLDWAAGAVWLTPDRDMRLVAELPTLPAELDTFDTRAKWRRDWAASDKGRQRFHLLSMKRKVVLSSDGSFMAELVEPGTYRIDGTWFANGQALASLNKVVQVPPVATGAPNAPFDLGKFTIQAAVKVGDLAPDFSIITLDNGPLNLSDYRGKYVLLDFWATWCGWCVEETPDLKATYEAFGKDKRFAMISLSLDSDSAAPKTFARSHHIGWTQGFLGDWYHDKVTRAYGVFGIPSIFLIGPDGRILATGLGGPRIEEAVAAALAPK